MPDAPRPSRKRTFALGDNENARLPRARARTRRGKEDAAQRVVRRPVMERSTDELGPRSRTSLLFGWMQNPRIYAAIGFIATCLIIFTTFHRTMGSTMLGRPYLGKTLVELFRDEHGSWVWNWHYAPMLACVLVIAALLYLIVTTTKGGAWRGRLLIAATGLTMFIGRPGDSQLLDFALGVGLVVGGLLVPRRERSRTGWLVLITGFALLVSYLAFPIGQSRLHKNYMFGYHSNLTSAVAATRDFTELPSNEIPETRPTDSPLISRVGVLAPIYIAVCLVVLLLGAFVGLEGRASRILASLMLIALVVVTAATYFCVHYQPVTKGAISLTAMEHGLQQLGEQWRLGGVPFVPGIAAAVMLLARRRARDVGSSTREQLKSHDRSRPLTA